MSSSSKKQKQDQKQQAGDAARGYVRERIAHARGQPAVANTAGRLASVALQDHSAGFDASGEQDRADLYSIKRAIMATGTNGGYAAVSSLIDEQFNGKRTGFFYAPLLETIVPGWDTVQ